MAFIFTLIKNRTHSRAKLGQQLVAHVLVHVKVALDPFELDAENREKGDPDNVNFESDRAQRH